MSLCLIYSFKFFSPNKKINKRQMFRQSYDCHHQWLKYKKVKVQKNSPFYTEAEGRNHASGIPACVEWVVYWA